MQSVHHSHQSSSQGIPCTNNNTNLGGNNSPLVMPVFPLRTSHSGHGSNYSPYSPSRFVLRDIELSVYFQYDFFMYFFCSTNFFLFVFFDESG